jgi:hypothetical protein
MGISVKVLTGDNAEVSAKVCADLGLAPGTPLSGREVESASDADLVRLIDGTTIFARAGPEQKARIVRVERQRGTAVAFLGDGVNDALALHSADVGISVDTATDIAKDAADVILMEKDLAVLADGVIGGRRIFANTMKCVLMGTSSNFGNRFSAAGASAFLRFLPMLPSQILLNSLLYDSSQLAIPSDNVDAEQLTLPTRWDVHFIRRFILPESGKRGLVARGHRRGDDRNDPAADSGRARPGFRPLPGAFFLVLALMVVCYLGLIEAGKHWFYRELASPDVPAGAAGQTGSSGGRPDFSTARGIRQDPVGRQT